MELFSLEDRVVVITGGAGLLGQQHAMAVAEAGGTPVVLDKAADALANTVNLLESRGLTCEAIEVDATNLKDLEQTAKMIRTKHGLVYGLINNLSSNPPPSDSLGPESALETYPVNSWDLDLRLGLTSALVNSQVFGRHMVELGRGSIVNVASDLAIISPDQRIYRNAENPSDSFAKKAVSYSVVKSGLLGLTKYLSTYWAPLPIRANALLPGSVRGNQSAHLINELEQRIPLRRLSEPDEYKGAIVFMLSDASSYMTGTNLIIDGGRTVW
jgi:NAD(P)-dependent dehydrogenase (short-subunit alcohol dehydrogenase family)